MLEMKYFRASQKNEQNVVQQKLQTVKVFPPPSAGGQTRPRSPTRSRINNNFSLKLIGEQVSITTMSGRGYTLTERKLTADQLSVKHMRSEEDKHRRRTATPADMSQPVNGPRRHVEKAGEISAVDGGEDGEEPRVDSEPPGTIRAVPIHRRPDLLVPCADLVNSEWQRSQAARVHSLQKSCPEFPVSLVLLQGRGEAERLLGHVRLSRVVGHGGSLFVESVVVSEAERGKGHGRTLMEETERYCKRRGFGRLRLTTHDKQHFYAHLGYVLSTPVQSAGAMASFVPMEMLLRFSRTQGDEMRTEMRTQTKAEAQTGSKDSDGACVVGSSPPTLPPPPPPSLCPPPPPPPPSLCPPPPPPLCPPPRPPLCPAPPPLSSIPTPPPPPAAHTPSPPPPPPQSAGQLVIQTLTQTPYRDGKGVPIYWMHKDI